VNQADRVAKAIDAISANSDHETRTQTEQAATANWMKQLADIGLIVGSIMGAVFFTLLLLSGNTMMQAVRERTSELAVLKTIGFSNHAVLGIVLAESVLLLLLGGVIGLGLASLIIPAVSAARGRHQQLGARHPADDRDRFAGGCVAGDPCDAPEHRRRAGWPLRRAT
jgi:putative ABC transport system permease protein